MFEKDTASVQSISKHDRKMQSNNNNGVYITEYISPDLALSSENFIKPEVIDTDQISMTLSDQMLDINSAYLNKLRMCEADCIETITLCEKSV